MEIRKEDKNESFFADIICEMIKIMMMEDELNINECYNILSEYYNIPENKLRMLVHSQYKKTKNKKYLHFSYDYIIYEKNKKKFISRHNIVQCYKKILKKITSKLKNFGELNENEQIILIEEIIKFSKIK